MTINLGKPKDKLSLTPRPHSTLPQVTMAYEEKQLPHQTKCCPGMEFQYNIPRLNISIDKY